MTLIDAFCVSILSILIQFHCFTIRWRKNEKLKLYPSFTSYKNQYAACRVQFAVVSVQGCVFSVQGFV